MFAHLSLVPLLLHLLGLAGSSHATPAPRTAADYLAHTTWLCHLPPTAEYVAHRCSPSPLTKPCTAQWLARCEAEGGAVQSCGAHDCDDAYVGKRADLDTWRRNRIRALRKAMARKPGHTR